MALPAQISAITPAGSDSPALGDDQFRALKLFVEDVFGIPDATNITVAVLVVEAGGLTAVPFRDSAANPTVAGRMQRNGAVLLWHDGTSAKAVQLAGGTDIAVADGGTGLSSGTSGGVLAFTAATTLASSGVLTDAALVVGGGAGAVPETIAALTNGQLPIGSTGANPVPATLTPGTGTQIVNAAGSITVYPDFLALETLSA